MTGELATLTRGQPAFGEADLDALTQLARAIFGASLSLCSQCCTPAKS